VSEPIKAGNSFQCKSLVLEPSLAQRPSSEWIRRIRRGGFNRPPPSCRCQSLNGLHRRQESDRTSPIVAAGGSPSPARRGSRRVVNCPILMNANPQWTSLLNMSALLNKVSCRADIQCPTNRLIPKRWRHKQCQYCFQTHAALDMFRCWLRAKT
jgi:hypothetical protein